MKHYMVSAVIVALFVALLSGCSQGDEIAGGDTDHNTCISCITNEQCPFGMSCITTADGNCCISSEIEGTNKCLIDTDCGDSQTQICCDGECVSKFPNCPPDSNCHNGQTCNYDVGKCIGTPTCGPVDTDGDLDTVTEDETPVEEPTDQADTQDNQTDPDATACSADSDCGEKEICGPNRVCIADCTQSGCDADEGSCNTLNGHCEWCSPKCKADESCNYNGSKWFCGTPCATPCAEGTACNGGSCTPLICPACPSGSVCSGSTGYVCKVSGGDTDTDTSPTPNEPACLPATAPCVEGVSKCCSGACLLGNCM